jgi:hypothetical protein
MEIMKSEFSQGGVIYMMTKIIYALALVFLFTLSSIPLNADKISQEVVCFYEWGVEHEYQGSKALCLTPEDVRALVSENGKTYTFEPAENANSSLSKLLKSNALLDKTVVVIGTIEKDNPVDIIKVERLLIE